MRSKDKFALGVMAVLLAGCAAAPPPLPAPAPGPNAKIKDAQTAIAIAQEACRPDIEKMDATARAAFDEALSRSPWKAVFDPGVAFALDGLGKTLDRTGAWIVMVGADRSHICERQVMIAASTGKTEGCGICIIVT